MDKIAQNLLHRVTIGDLLTRAAERPQRVNGDVVPSKLDQRARQRA